MHNAYKRTLSAFAALAVTAIPLTVFAPAQAAPGDFTQNSAHGSVDQQPDGTYLYTGGWEYTVDVTDYPAPVTFTANVLIARDDNNDYYGDARPVCTSDVDATSNLATVTCDGEVTVPTALANYRVTSLLFARDADGNRVGDTTMSFDWEDPSQVVDPPVDPVDPVDPDPNTSNCPAVPGPGPILTGCVYVVGNVPVTCVDSLFHERWIPGTGTAEFKGGRKKNGDLWRDEPLKVEAGHVVLTDRKFAHEPFTAGEACDDTSRRTVLEEFYNATDFGMTELWHGTPESGGYSEWEGRTNGYRLGDYGYAAVNTLVECRTYDGTNIIASCDEPFTGIDESEKITLACDGPRYRSSEDPDGSMQYGGWTDVAPKLLTEAGCKADVPVVPEVPETPVVPTPEVPEVPETPEVPTPDVPETPEVPEVPTDDVPVTPETPKDPTPEIPTIDAGAAHAVAPSVTGQVAATSNGMATSGLFLCFALGLGLVASRRRYAGRHLE